MSQFDRQDAHDPNEDYYHILGLDDDATPAEMRLAYRDLVRQYHPDSGYVGGTTLLFRRIQQAYETLSDPERRQKYDTRLRREGKRPPALLDLDVTLGPTTLPQLDEAQLLYALIKITPISTRPLARIPLNLCLVLDRSTSMKSERLDAIRKATLSVVSQIEPEDIFSLVTFSDRAEVLIPAQHKPDMRTLRSILSTISSGGGTEIYHGLAAGLGEVTRVRSDRQINHMILLTDGHTYGDAEQCLIAAHAAARQDIGISGIGVGNDWNEDFLDHLAAAGGGTVMYIERSANIGTAFERKLRALKDAWIPDMKLRIRHDPIASHKELFSIAPELRRLNDNADEFLIGPLQRNESRLLLLETIVSPQPDGLHRILRLEVEGSVPAFGRAAIYQQALRVEFQPSTRTRTLIPPAIIEAAQQVSLLRMQEHIQSEVGQGLIDSAASRLETLSNALMQKGRADLADTFQREARQLATTGMFTDAGTKRIRYGTRSFSLPATTG